MNVKVIRGSRSEKYLAEEWQCEGCGCLHVPTHHLIFDLTVMRCVCGKTFGGLIYFCLADVEVNGHSILPDVKNQGSAPECVPFAFCNAKEMNDKVEKIILGESPGDETLDPFDLANMYNDRFPELPHGFPYGLHKLLYVGILLREFGCRTINGRERSKISDFFTIPLGNSEMAWQMIADGRAVVATFTVSEAFSKLQFGEVYDPSPVLDLKRKHKDFGGHAVLLIGGIHFGEHNLDIFLNTHGKEFWALRNSAGEIVIGGIGMFLSQKFCNPVVLCRSWETVLKGRLEGLWMVNESETDQMFSTRGKRGLNDISGVVAAGPTKAVDCARHDNTAGVDVNAGRAVTPLVIAATDGLPDFFKCLLEAGADPDIRDEIGRMPIEIAVIQGWKDCVHEIVKHVPNDGTVLKARGDVAFHEKDYPRASALYSKAIESGSNDPILDVMRSLCGFHMGEEDKAVEDAGNYEGMERDLLDYCCEHGPALTMMKAYVQACKALRSGLKLDSGGEGSDLTGEASRDKHP